MKMKLKDSGPHGGQIQCSRLADLCQGQDDMARILEDRKFVCLSKELVKSVSLARRAAVTKFSVLLNGKTGVGKTTIARMVHDLSKRCSGQFVVADCLEGGPSVVYSVFFGYKGSSFTGAEKKDRKGLFDDADRGTIFLDNIQNLDIHAQRNLLRVLDEGRFLRFGDSRPVEVDVRIISGSNVDLRQMVERGEFREDLYYRISTIPVFVPSLRARQEEIPALVRVLAERMEREDCVAMPRFSDGAIRRLRKSPLRGNVRELRNLMARCSVLAMGGSQTGDADVCAAMQMDKWPTEKRRKRAVLRKEVVQKAIERYGSQTAAELELGWSRREIGRVLKGE